MTAHIEVRNWERFQHYQKRDPPWIKLYNSLLDDYDLMELDPRLRWAGVAMLLLASRTGNRIPANLSALQNRLWMDDLTVSDVEKLASVGLIRLSQDASKTLAGCRPKERRGETETEGDANASPPETVPVSEGASDPPISELWNIFLEELGGEGRPPTLTRARREKLRLFRDEYLQAVPDPLGRFRSLLRAVKQSEHHMSVRDYQMPESLFANRERRDKWAMKAEFYESGDPNRPSSADRRIIARRQEMESWDLTGALR